LTLVLLAGLALTASSGPFASAQPAPTGSAQPAPGSAGPASAPSRPTEPARDPLSADLAVATVMAFEVTTLATGELEAARQIDIRNQLEQPTTITELVKEGSRVKAGDVLVRLNSEQIERSISEEQLRVEQARADVAVAQNAVDIRMSDNESAIRKSTLDLEVARLELRQWLEGDVKSRRQALELALDKAARELTRLTERFERAKSLAREGFLSTDELKRDELAYLEADANLKTAELNRRVYEGIQFGKDQKIKQSAVDEAQAALERTRRTNESNLASRQAELANRRESLRLREENLAKLRAQLDATVLKAPTDGLVVYATSLNRERWGGGGGGDAALDVGRQVTRNQQLIVLPDVSEMVAAVRVHESLAGRIRPGMKATVRVDALGGRAVPGEVLSVGVLAESGGWRDPNLREYTVKVKLDYPDPSSVLKPSMRAEAEILLDRVPPTLAVPIQAVFNEGLVRFVYVPQGEQFAKVPVRLGRRSDRFIEISTGLSEGQRVLVRRPQDGEVVPGAWSAAQLASVGLKLDDQGRVAPVAGGPGGPGGSGGPPGTGERRRARPDGTPAGEPAVPATNPAASAPTSAAPPTAQPPAPARPGTR
jgi:HlyD family secretion protein